MIHKLALRAAGLVAIGTAIYHGVSGDGMLQAMEMSSADFDFVRSTYHLGTMGWMAGGALLFAAASMASQQARNWIVGVYCVMYGFPALGTFALTGGKPSLGGVLLATVVILALLGRKLNSAENLPLTVATA